MNQDQNRDARYALAILFAVNMMNFFDRQIIASVSKPIIDEWGLTDTQMGLIGTAFIWIYAAVGLPFGIWADRGSRKKLLSLSVTIWSLFTAASGLAWNYGALFLARLGVGVGESGCSPAGNSLIGDLYPASKRGKAIAIFMLGLPIGIFLSNMFSGLIAKAVGWRWVFFVATIPGLILAALALKIKEPLRGASEAALSDGHERSLKEFILRYLRVLATPTMWWIVLSGALHNFNAYTVNSFIPLYLGRHHGLDIRNANFIAAIVLGAVGVVGLIIGGWMADWSRKRGPRGRMVVAALALLISTPCVYLAIEQPKGSLISFMALMGFGWMLIYIYYVTVYPAIQDVVEPSLRGSAMALYFFGMYFLGGAYGTWITGALSDHFARAAMLAAGASTLEPFRAIGLQKAFYVVPLVSLALTFVLFAGALTIRKDVEKLQKRLSEPAVK
ncbi:MAG TPA: MFS transporter [Blastocatellia bacterium]